MSFMKSAVVKTVTLTRTGFVQSKFSSSVDNHVPDCASCRDLGRVFRSRMAKYVEACSSPFYRVSKDLAAKTQVDMERARNDLQEHLLICANPAADKAHLDGVALPSAAVDE
jgi:hypothetical protein